MATLAADFDFHPRRRKARLRVGIPATLVTLDGRQDISLVDLSETGARVKVENAETIGNGVLHWLGFEAFGSIVWRRGQTVGIHFDSPIDSDWVLTTREWLPKLPSSKEELKRFARDWVNGAPPRRQPARIPGMPMTRYYSGKVQRQRWNANEWLRAGHPFIAGGIVLGLIAGYCSVIF
jgi:hypothetical protein